MLCVELDVSIVRVPSNIQSRKMFVGKLFRTVFHISLIHPLSQFGFFLCLYEGSASAGFVVLGWVAIWVYLHNT